MHRMTLSRVHGRDHDHRDMPQLLVGLELLEHLVAVQLRHHDVQQDEIEPLGAEAVQRLPSVYGGGNVGVALPLEPAGERVAVVFVVVDDEECVIRRLHRGLLYAINRSATCLYNALKGWSGYRSAKMPSLDKTISSSA